MMQSCTSENESVWHEKNAQERGHVKVKTSQNSRSCRISHILHEILLKFFKKLKRVKVKTNQNFIRKKCARTRPCKSENESEFNKKKWSRTRP